MSEQLVKAVKAKSRAVKFVRKTHKSWLKRCKNWSKSCYEDNLWHFTEFYGILGLKSCRLLFRLGNCNIQSVANYSVYFKSIQLVTEFFQPGELLSFYREDLFKDWTNSAPFLTNFTTFNTQFIVLITKFCKF